MASSSECPHLQGLKTNLATQVGQASACSVSGCGAPASAVWVCLTPGCMFCGCGRDANQHTLKHAMALGHPVVMHRQTSMIWCYTCDMELVEDDDHFSDAYNDVLRACRAAVYAVPQGTSIPGGWASSSAAPPARPTDMEIPTAAARAAAAAADGSAGDASGSSGGGGSAYTGSTLAPAPPGYAVGGSSGGGGGGAPLSSRSARAMASAGGAPPPGTGGGAPTAPVAYHTNAMHSSGGGGGGGGGSRGSHRGVPASGSAGSGAAAASGGRAAPATPQVVVDAAPVRRDDPLTPLVVTYPLTGGLTGLANLGNTCFMNAGLQALSNVPALACYFAEIAFTAKTAYAAYTLPMAFKYLMADMWYRGHAGRPAPPLALASVAGGHVNTDDMPALPPSEIFRCLRRANPIFEGYQQHDSHEALRTILNDLHERLAIDVPVGLYSTTAAAAAAAASAAASAGTGGGASAAGSGLLSIGPLPPPPGAGGAASGSKRPPPPRSVHGTTGSSASARAAAMRHASGGARDSDDDDEDDEEEEEDDTDGGGRAGRRGRGQRGSHASDGAGGSDDDEEDASDDAAAAGGGRHGPTKVRRVGSRGHSMDGGSGGSTPYAAHASGGRHRGSSGGTTSGSSGGSGYTVRADRQWLFDGPYTGPETAQRSIISDLFQGVLQSRVRCKTCNTDSVTFDTFYDLSLPVPRHQHPLARGSDGTRVPASNPKYAEWRAAAAGDAGTGEGDTGYPEGYELPTGAPLTSPLPGMGSHYAFRSGSAGAAGGSGADGAVVGNAMRVTPAGGAAPPGTSATPSDSASTVTIASASSAGSGSTAASPALSTAAAAPGTAASAEHVSVAVDGSSAAGAAGGAGGGAAPPAAPTAAVVPVAVDDDGSGGGWLAALGRLFCSSRSGLGGMLLGSSDGGDRPVTGTGIGLGDCLYSFFDWEELKGDDAYYCEVCACKREAIKRVAIVSLPEVLCVQLKRFNYNGWNGSASKNSTTVHFPLASLDMSPFTGQFAHAAAVRSYIRAKEQQTGARVAQLLGVAGGSGAAATASAPAAAGAGAASASGGPPRRVLHTLAPETRALLLHRHAIATGSTGVEPVAAAAAAVAAATGHHLGSPTGHGTGTALAPSASVLASAAAAADAAARVTGAVLPSTGSSQSLVGALAGGSSASASTSPLVGSSAPPAGAADGSSGGILSPLAAAAAAVASASSSSSSSSASASPPSPILSPVPVPLSKRVGSVTMGPAVYDAVSFVQHIGSIGGGHYIAHAKHRGTGKWYTYDDTTVTGRDTSEVLRREAYVLFYVRRREGDCAPVPLPAAKRDEPITRYVSRYWWLRYCMMAVPGPISNADITCDHGAIKITLADTLTHQAVGLTQRQYDTLATHYGAADPPLCDLSTCKECEYEARILAARRKRECEQITAVDTTTLAASASGDAGCWFIMSEWWLAKWRAFIHDKGAMDGTGRGVLPPGPIDNARLLGKDGTPLPNLRASTHYRGVNANVWNFLHAIYGGGPVLKRREINIYTPPVP